MPVRLSVRPFAPVVLALLVAVASCLPGARAPNVSPTRTLDLAARETSAPASARPFAVVQAGPKGETDDPSEVTIVFNRPMRPLELASDEAETAPPASIVATHTKAAPKGAWRWMGTSALVFAPDPRLPRATAYEVTVPKGTRALDGSTLGEAYTFTFTTPPPKLVRIDPSEGETHLAPRATFELRFNQPVDPNEVARATKILVGDAGKGRAVAFRASRPKADVLGLVKLTPSSPLPLASRIAVKVGAALHGLEGPLPVGEERTVTLATYGPLTASGVACATETPHKKCSASGYVSIELSNRASLKEIRAHVRLEGAPLAWPTTRADDEKTRYVGLDAKLLPATAYTVVVTPGLRDEYGQTLAKEVRLPFETDDEWPDVTIGVSGTTFESKVASARPAQAQDVPIAAMNVTRYELVAAALDEAKLAKFVLDEGRGSGTRRQFEAAKALVGGKSETVVPAAAPNERAVRMVHLDALLEPSKRHGAALIAVRQDPVQGRPSVETRVVALTDLAISAKMSRFGSLVWVTHLSTGKPAPGATVVVRTKDRELLAVTADGNGVATIPPERYAPIDARGREDENALIVARLGDDWTWRRVSDALSPWQYAPSSDPSGRLTPMGMLFTDRGIYKTSETIRVKGLFRVPRPKGTETPKGRAVTLEAFDSTDTKIFEQKATLGAFGELAADVPVPASARLGNLEIRASFEGQPAKTDDEDGDGRGATASAVVQLAAYRPAEFKVGVETDKPAYVRGDKAAFTVRGDYLFGAPMSGGKVRFTVTRGVGFFAPPGTEALVMDDDAYASGLSDANARAGEMQSGDGALSDKGAFAGAVALGLPHQRGAEVVSIEGEVEDVSRQTIAGRASVIVHPAEFYLGLTPPKDMFVPKGARLRPEVQAIEPTGRRRSGVPVRVELVKRTWQSVLDGSSNLGHWESRTVDKTVASCTLTTAAAPVACDLAPTEAGYFLLRASANDPRRNPVAASTSLYVLGEGEGIGWRMDDTSLLELVTDKKTYEVGDVAKILVKSPFRDADAWVTVERAGVYRQERMTLTGAMPTLSIPVTDDMRPNAFVAVHLVRGRTQAPPARGKDVGAPAFRLGYAEITVNPEARRLKVGITPSRRDYRPGEDVDVDLAVTDAKGRGARGEVTFYAVDEGVLMLTGYKTPDPVPVFTAPRPLAVLSLESREDLARVLFTAKGVGTDKGDEGGGGGGMREDFRSTAFFQPSVVTDGGGKAHVRFKLPDSLTTYRLMAVVAAEDDRFGFGESQIVASRKLMARPNLPRFFRAGDAADAGIVLSSKGLGASDVEVTIDAKGLVVSGETKRTIALPANGSVEVRWPLATPSVGEATIAFHARARGSDAADDVRITRIIEEPVRPEAVALYGETKSAVAERLGDLGAIRSDVGGLDLRLASTALVGLDDGVEQLIEYPYGCTEQLTSRLVPLLPLRALAADYHIALPADLNAAIEKTVAKITQNQQEDGGFGWWPDAPRAETWLTAYALWGLSLAKAHGAHVPDGVIENATRYVRHALETDLENERLGGATAAFVLDVLAAVGSPDAGYTNRLFDSRAKLPLFARALLAHAMVVAKMDPAQAKELLRDVENHLRVSASGATVVENLGDEYAVLLDSEARTTAMVLRALVAADPNHPLAARIAKGLLSMRRGGTWRSTQETAWALLALDDYRHAQEKDEPQLDASVFLGNERLFAAAFHGRSAVAKTASYGAAKLFAAGASGATLAFQAEGRGTLFYEARLRYARKELPTKGIDRGFFVRKLVRSVRPEALADALSILPAASANVANGGDLVLVDLLIVTPDPREQVVIDDPLPAGLEAVQANLATTARSLDVADEGGQGDEADEEASDDDEQSADRAYGSAWYRREIRDDRVLTFVPHMPAGMFHYRYLARATTFGRFVVPPTHAECMYEPETFGRTAASVFDVRAGR